LPLLRGVLLELFHTRLRGRESLGLGAALMLRGLECAGPVLHLAPRAGPLLLELAEPAAFRREGRLELRIPRAQLGERLFVSCGRRRGAGRCGAHLGERLGELGALGPEPRGIALLPRGAAALPAVHRPRDARQLALALLALALQIPDELFENPPAALRALQRLDETEHALALLAQIVHRACGAGAILREALLMLRVLIALQARCA